MINLPKFFLLNINSLLVTKRMLERSSNTICSSLKKWIEFLLILRFSKLSSLSMKIFLWYAFKDKSYVFVKTEKSSLDAAEFLLSTSGIKVINSLALPNLVILGFSCELFLCVFSCIEPFIALAL